MPRTRMLCVTVLLILFLPGLAGCQENESEASEYYVYYVDKDWTHTVAEGYKPEASGTEELIEELLRQLSRNTDSPDYRRAMSGDVRVESWKLDNSQLYLYFNSDYQEMDHVTEVLCRAAVVRTLVQVEGVENVTFFVGDKPLVDENGTVVGLMTADNFIENPGEQINSFQTTSITLYFASKDGTKLVQEVQDDVYYSSNISLEKLIMEHLLKGPKSKEMRGAVPSGTKLVSVSVLDGVCFVNLDEGFLKQNYEIAEPVVIYSIVNSLVELPNINKVQIAVNGDSSMKYREKYDLNTMYERNLDYLDDGAKTGEEQIKEREDAGE